MGFENYTSTKENKDVEKTDAEVLSIGLENEPAPLSKIIEILKGYPKIQKALVLASVVTAAGGVMDSAEAASILKMGPAVVEMGDNDAVDNDPFESDPRLKAFKGSDSNSEKIGDIDTFEASDIAKTVQENMKIDLPDIGTKF